MGKKRVLALSMSLLMSATVFAGCSAPEASLKISPYDYMKWSAAKSIMAVSETRDVGVNKIINAALENGTVCANYVNNDFEVDADIYQNVAAKQYQIDASLKNGGKGMTGGATIDSKEIVVYADSESGEFAYSIPYADIEEKAGKSIFGTDSSSKYSLSESELKSFVDAVKQVEDAVNGNETEDKVITDIIENNIRELKPEVTNGSYDFNGTVANATVINYKLNSENLAALVENCYDDIIASKKLSEDTVSIIRDSIDVDELTGVFGEYNISTDISFYINSKTNMLMQAYGTVNLKDDTSSAKVVLNLELGADPASSKEQSFTIKMIEGEDKITVSAISTLEENSKDTYSEKAVLKITDGKEVISFRGYFNLDKKSGDYSAKVILPKALFGEKQTITLTGVIKADDHNATVSFDKIAIPESEVEENVNVTLSFSDSGKFTKKNSKELMLITEKKLDKTLASIEADFDDVMCSGDNDISNYYRKSKLSSANSNAKIVYTATMTGLTELSVNGKKIKNTELANSKDGNYNFKVGDSSLKLNDYLGNDFNGYFYAKIDTSKQSVEYVVWSDAAIPAEYRRALSADECAEYFAKTGNMIGCYPLSNNK